MFLVQVALILLASVSILEANNTVKRGIPYDSGYGYGPITFQSVLPALEGPVFNPHFNSEQPPPSPSLIATALHQARQASHRVHSAQQLVHAAKQALLEQEHIARERRERARLAWQRAEAAAALEQQEARSAAEALVEAQRRLAQSKQEVAVRQKEAGIKESWAAKIIGKAAKAAQDEIIRSDETARKIAALQHAGTVTLKQLGASKEDSISATSAAVEAAHNNDHLNHGPLRVLPVGKLVQIHPWG